MKTNQYTPVASFLLAFCACLVATAACIVPDWFEYTAEWNPPKVGGGRPYFSHNAKELLPLFGIGPETFSRRLEDSDTTGCYVIAWCSPTVRPHRLYTASFSAGQRHTILAMRFVGVLGVITNLITMVFVVSRHRTCFRQLRNHRPIGFTFGCVGLALVGVLALLACGLEYTGPYVGAIFGSEYPSNCVVSSPPDVECLGYHGAPLYALQSGTSEWEFKRVLLKGPAWTLFSLVPVPVAWLVNKWRFVKGEG
jgi:hypothetical protein